MNRRFLDMKEALPILFLLVIFAGSSFAATDTTTQPFEVAKLKAKAEKEDADAQSTIGYLYANGQGLPQDYTEAAKWYRKAAEQGNASAQINLGQLYDRGRGVKQDYAEAYFWYILGANAAMASFREEAARAAQHACAPGRH